ncbi:MAG: 30S ribosomal protein S16 [Nocardioidaceae bacterium]
MAVKIRLKRMGKIRAPFYRIVVADSRTKRDGRVIEEIGTYNPKADPSVIHVNSERAQYWLGVGAQPSEPVAAILKLTGDWQQYKGEPAPPPLLVAEPKKDKTEIFNEALKEAQSEPKSEAVTKRRAKKAEAPKADESRAAEPKAVEPKAAEPKADEADQPRGVADKAVAEGPHGPDSAAALEDGSAPAGFEIKGNADSMKFHAPSSPWYDRTVAEVWFRTAEAAEKAGFVNAETTEKAGDAAEPKADEADQPRGVADKAVAEGPHGPDSAAALEDGSAPAGFEIKGNADSMKFHAPSSPWYDRTVAEVWFRTAEAAEKAGFVNAEKAEA